MKNMIIKYSQLVFVLFILISGCSFNDNSTEPAANTNNNLKLENPKDGALAVPVIGATLKWNANLTAGTTYQVFLEPTTGKGILPTASVWNTTPKVIGLTSNSFSAEQLAFSTWYAWKVRAMLPNGTWQDSQVQYFQTEDIPPTAYNSLRVIDYTTNFNPNNPTGDRIITIVFQATDPAGNGITNLTRNQFEVLEDGEPLREFELGFSQQAASKIVVPVHILIDNSTSIKANNRLPIMKADATEIVNRLSTSAALTSFFNIYQFSESLSPQVGTITPPGVSATQARVDISAIQNGAASTDFNGAVADVASSMVNSFMVSEIKQHIMIVLSDGDDTAGKRMLSEATNAVSGKRVFSIGYAGDLREDILKMVGVSGYFNRSINGDFSSYLNNVRTYLESTARSFYVLTVTSPKRGYRNHTISIRMHGSMNPISVTYPGW